VAALPQTPVVSNAGVTGIVLNYRVPRRPGQPEPLPAPGPLVDAQRAVSRCGAGRRSGDRLEPYRHGRIVGEWTSGGRDGDALRPARLRTDRRDRQSQLPAGLCGRGLSGLSDCPVSRGVETNKNILAPYIRIPTETPPIFLVHASDDPVAGAENSVLMYLALNRANVATELHVFAAGGHVGSACVKAARPARLGRIAVSSGCKPRACSARKENDQRRARHRATRTNVI